MRRVPVQSSGSYWLTPSDPRRGTAVGPGTISWDEHLLAWEAYSARFGVEQSAERIVERGGFGHEELRMLLGREPETFEPTGSL